VTAPPAELPAKTTQAAESAVGQTGSRSPERRAGVRGGRLAAAWRQSRWPLAVIVFVITGVIAIVLLAPAPKSNIYLDPASTADQGTKALADILAERGFHVTAVYSPADALAAIASDQSSRPVVTLVITSPDLLTRQQRRQLRAADADLVLVEPGNAALLDFAPNVRVANPGAPLGGPVDPACALPGARLAGSADEGGITYQGPSHATRCYPVDGYPSVIRYRQGSRIVTILGSGQPLSNALLGLDGNAALALNLLSAHSAIVWLTPEPTLAAGTPPVTTGGRPGPSLIPAAAWLVAGELCVALLLAALWRARRFGPLISEQLPVVVRASETVEGHARLYQSRRARARAADALRYDLLSRIAPTLGLAKDAPMDAVTENLAGRSRRSMEEIAAIVYGPPPATDADLVRLAHDLDQLEREVSSQ
jgi:hypothetical protein